VVEVLMANHQELDLTVPKHPVHSFLGEAQLHPFRPATRIEQETVRRPVRTLGLHQSRGTGSVLRVPVAQRRPVDGILVDILATLGFDIGEQRLGVEPAGLVSVS
jgi:hypothetical protein